MISAHFTNRTGWPISITDDTTHTYYRIVGVGAGSYITGQCSAEFFYIERTPSAYEGFIVRYYPLKIQTDWHSSHRCSHYWGIEGFCLGRLALPQAVLLFLLKIAFCSYLIVSQNLG